MRERRVGGAGAANEIWVLAGFGERWTVAGNNLRGQGASRTYGGMGLSCLEVSQNKGIDAFPGGPTTHLRGRATDGHTDAGRLSPPSYRQ